MQWAEGMLWDSPERHSAIAAIMKAQIGSTPLALGGARRTQGKTLAVMEVPGGNQRLNAVNRMRMLGRWMRMLVIPNQSSIAKAFTEFDGQHCLKPSSFYLRVLDVCEELVKLT